LTTLTAKHKPAPQILCVGDNTVDIYVDRRTMYPGGNAVNVAVLARRDGAKSGYIGCVSTDRYGQLVYESLTAERVDLASCRRSDGPSPKALVGHRGNDRYFIGSMPGVRADFTLSDADDTAMAEADIVHTSISSDLDAELPRIRQAAKVLSYDFSNRWLNSHLEHCACLVDIAFVSAPGRDAEACIVLMREWAAKGTRIVVMTRGEEGSLALEAGVLHRQPVMPANVVDTLGAGDAFIAGFLVAHAGGASVPDALLAAARSAAETCNVMGAFGYGREHPWEIPNLPPPKRPER
jgi:fructoselysine 6-kinase